MSQWTHVTAMFRCDWLGGTRLSEQPGKRMFRGEVMGVDGIIERVFGRAIRMPIDLDAILELERLETPEADAVVDAAYGEYDRLWEAYEQDPDAFLPTGSEGSLSVAWADSREQHGDVVVTVFGDLRDFGEAGDIEALRRWFERSCAGVEALRQAVCCAYEEWGGETHTWVGGWTGGCDRDEAAGDDG